MKLEIKDEYKWDTYNQFYKWEVYLNGEYMKSTSKEDAFKIFSAFRRMFTEVNFGKSPGKYILEFD